LACGRGAGHAAVEGPGLAGNGAAGGGRGGRIGHAPSRREAYLLSPRPLMRKIFCQQDKLMPQSRKPGKVYFPVAVMYGSIRPKQSVQKALQNKVANPIRLAYNRTEAFLLR